MVLFIVGMVFGTGILGMAGNILKNTAVEEKMLEFRAEELATSIGLLSSFDESNFVEFEKRLGSTYRLNFHGSGGTENLTMAPNASLSDKVEVVIPSEESLPSKTIVNSSICMNSSHGSGGIEIYEGEC